MNDFSPITCTRVPDSPADGNTAALGRMSLQLQRAYLESTWALVAAVEARDHYTRLHSQNASRYCGCIGRRMGLDHNELLVIETAAMLHDVGKIGISDAILRKPGPLTADEYNTIKRHPRMGAEIIEPASFLRREARIVLHHHERWDGAGYPSGLAGEEIPPGARILCVADSLDAMLTVRPYRQPRSLEEARAELIRQSGRQFDPSVVEAVSAWLDTSPELPPGAGPPDKASQSRFRSQPGQPSGRARACAHT